MNFYSEYDTDSSSGDSGRKKLDKQAKLEEKQFIKEQFQLRGGGKLSDNEVKLKTNKFVSVYMGKIYNHFIFTF